MYHATFDLIQHYAGMLNNLELSKNCFIVWILSKKNQDIKHVMFN